MKCFRGGKQLKYAVPSWSQCLGCRQSNGWTGGTLLSIAERQKSKCSSDIATPVHTADEQKPHELFYCDNIWCHCSWKSQWKLAQILALSPIAAEAAELRCQHCLPKVAGSNRARAAPCEPLLQLRSFISRPSFSFLWEQKQVSGGMFGKCFSDMGWSNQSKWQNFITTSHACCLFVSRFPKLLVLQSEGCLNPPRLQLATKQSFYF